MRAECTDTRSRAMTMLSLDHLCALLKYALQRMKHVGVGGIKEISAHFNNSFVRLVLRRDFFYTLFSALEMEKIH
jgi:hypothetical protein